MKQRDNQWRQARLADVTASRFHDVLTVTTSKGPFVIGGEKGAWCVCNQDTSEIVSGSFTLKKDATERCAELVAEWRKTQWSQTAETYVNELLSELIHCQPADVWRSDATDWGTANEPHAILGFDGDHRQLASDGKT